MNKQLIIFLTTLLTISLLLAGCGTNQSTELVESTESTDTSASSNPEETENPKESNHFYFTANEGGSISKMDSSTNKVIETIEIDGAVHNVQVSPDGNMLGVTVVPGGHHEKKESKDHSNGHAHQDYNEEVAIDTRGFVKFYDTNTNTLLNEIIVGNHPAHIDFTSDGQFALVTNNEDNNVSIINAKTFEITNTISTGKGPHGFRISSDDRFAYIANMGEDTISVINLETFQEDQKIKVGSTPVTTAITSDGKVLITSLHVENKVAIVDLETGDVTKIEVGNGPAQVYLQSDDRYVFVANQGSEENPADSVSKMDLSNKEVVATIQTGKGAHGVVTSSDNKFVYVTNMFDHTVSVIDNENNTVIETIDVGKVPNGISIMP